MPPTLSVAIVCRNNADTIGRTLESVAGLADEVVALDSGSTDGTLGVLGEHGARIIRAEWKGYIATKQMALDACTGDMVLCLDSDESLESETARARVRDVLRRTPPESGWELRRVVYYRGRALRHAWQPEWRVRLVRRGAFRWAGLDPHDFLAPIDPSEHAGRLDGAVIRHDSIGTFADFFGKQAGHARTMASSLYDRGHRGSLWRLAASPPGAFLKQIVLKQAWRDGWAGWLAAASSASAALMKHAILLELSRSDGEGKPS